ncbi:hypothetical protein [Streptomyces sp. NRRL S-4]|uniref:hypothetical protein n=1 Tax=Streptomyces sp. NRRL S-4 TaxID=1519471 RepID=UPI0006B4E380|nr:hypothetical protein [Streptomyces sp. NRRL S-4]KPC83524.1 hypothetical protein ADK82_07270 [Streptomyces sp. NRRL S-4]
MKSDLRMATVLRRAVDGETTASAERLEALVGGTEFTFTPKRNDRDQRRPVISCRPESAISRPDVRPARLLRPDPAVPRIT